jgi:hypothetical protein
VLAQLTGDPEQMRAPERMRFLLMFGVSWLTWNCSSDECPLSAVTECKKMSIFDMKFNM